jgi:arylsulfatase A-like enzyme
MNKYLFFLLLFLTQVIWAQKNTPKPNIIYILMDDLGIEEIEPYGNTIFKTPHLTKMAQEGMKFSKHYAGTSVCAPSRCALMTGKHTGNCEVRGNKQATPHGQMPISDQTVTVAELLKQAGYQTFLSGKWGLGIEGTSGEPTKQGFDAYYGFLDQILAHNNFPEYLLRNGQKEYLKNKVIWEPTQTTWSKGLGSYTPEENKAEYANDLFTQEGLKFIEEQADKKKPFFLYLAYTLPHNNGEAPKEIRFQSPTLKPYENENWTELEKNYAATISRMDDYVGQIMQKLKEKGIAENTIVFFTSDNGSTEDIPERFVQKNRYRGFKRSPYEGGILAPLLVWWEGKIKKGSISDLPTAQWDFLPTACELAGIAPPKDIDGISIVPTLTRKKQIKRKTKMYWEFHEQGGWQALQEGDYKLIYFVKKQVYELYNLKKDIGEKNNLVNQEPKIFEKMKKQLHNARSESSTFNF